MTCPHQSRTRDRGPFTCALGWHGGRPYLGNCLACIAAGRNTPEARAVAILEESGAASPAYRAFFDAHAGGTLDLPAPETMPSLSTMAGTAFAAVKDAVTSSQPTVPPEEQARRLSICQGCQYYTANSNNAKLRTTKHHRCVLCGCYLNLKSRLATSQCPAGKWQEGAGS